MTSAPLCLALLAALALAACGTAPPAESPAKEPAPSAAAPPAPPPPVEALPPAPPPPTPAERELAEGIALYDSGDFNGAIKQFQGAKEIWTDASPEGARLRVAAHKYQAFSYCVTNRRTQCRQQFVEALKIDPDFELDAAEKTHPMWGPEFERAKKQAKAPPPPAKPTTPPAKGKAATPATPATPPRPAQ